MGFLQVNVPSGGMEVPDDGGDRDQIIRSRLATAQILEPQLGFGSAISAGTSTAPNAEIQR